MAQAPANFRRIDRAETALGGCDDTLQGVDQSFQGLPLSDGIMGCRDRKTCQECPGVFHENANPAQECVPAQIRLDSAQDVPCGDAHGRRQITLRMSM